MVRWSLILQGCRVFRHLCSFDSLKRCARLCPRTHYLLVFSHSPQPTIGHATRCSTRGTLERAFAGDCLLAGGIPKGILWAGWNTDARCVSLFAFRNGPTNELTSDLKSNKNRILSGDDGQNSVVVRHCRVSSVSFILRIGFGHLL